LDEFFDGDFEGVDAQARDGRLRIDIQKLREFIAKQGLHALQVVRREVSYQ
jgi:hypothetical protein